MEEGLMKEEAMIELSKQVLDELYDDIMKRTNNGVEILFKKD